MLSCFHTERGMCSAHCSCPRNSAYCRNCGNSCVQCKNSFTLHNCMRWSGTHYLLSCFRSLTNQRRQRAHILFFFMGNFGAFRFVPVWKQIQLRGEMLQINKHINLFRPEKQTTGVKTPKESQKMWSRSSTKQTPNWLRHLWWEHDLPLIQITD